VYVGEKKSAYRVLMEKPDVKNQLLRHKLIWKDNNDMDLKEIERESGKIKK
jgi:hypothetical protein